ncbi:MAG: GNAT family N-acetyltransferase [Euryarchaeota archaeon]|nr:GNAT family N-acetyltransferase [Euryarchaeota archaeon]MDE1835636.1 GNAT family N-acetyltransferase [Euryarchaeota archaeon]MDE1878984.1 GNAT family N-acetyltransferase [Euryarchaeota archaeon]MDE2043742.1 GNAT family N-acetyltransferase [Thermoplasmata archaeon]
MSDSKAARLIEEAAAGHKETAHRITVRPAQAEDVPALAGLLVRLKRLNEEFDPLLKVRMDAEAHATRVLETAVKDPKMLVLAGEGTGPDQGRVVGVVRAALRDRIFYTPEVEGVILDIYLLPAFRRKNVGEYLLAETVRILKEKGAGIVTAEFPAQNQIAARFYAKRGFRPLNATHAKII